MTSEKTAEIEQKLYADPETRRALEFDRRMNSLPWLVEFALTAPFKLLVMAWYFFFCSLCALGVVDFEYYHGRRITWRRHK